VPDEFSTFAVEKFHGFINRIENDPIPSQGSTGPQPDAFNFGVSKILEKIVIIGCQFMLSHFLLLSCVECSLTGGYHPAATDPVTWSYFFCG
jgi:hypothetical protein